MVMGPILTYYLTQEIASGVGAIVALTACVYFGLSVQFSRRQHRLAVKAASYDIAVEELVCQPRLKFV